MGEIHIFCPIPLKGNKSKCRRLGKKHKNGILEGEKVSIGSKAGVEKTKYTGQHCYPRVTFSIVWVLRVCSINVRLDGTFLDYIAA